MFLPLPEYRDNLDFTWTMLGDYAPHSPSLRETILVPKGFVTDLASVPMPVWGIVPPVGKIVFGAIPHDWLYYTRGLEGRFSRLECDRAFEEWLRIIGMNPIKRAIVFRAVRIGSGARWEKVGGK